MALRRLGALGAAIFLVLLAPGALADDQPAPSPSSPPAAAEKPNPNAPLSADQIGSEFKHLSPEARDALLKQLMSKSSEDLTKMTPEQLTGAFGTLPPELQAQLRAKWDALSDEQRAALKKMNPDTLKQMFAQNVKQMVGDRVKEAVAPVQEAVAQSVEKVKEVAQTARSYVQKMLGKLFGSKDSKPPDQA